MNLNKYVELKNRHQNELKQIQLIYVFNRKDLNDGLKKLGLKKTDVDKLIPLNGGCYTTIENIKKLNKLLKKQNKKLKDEIRKDKDGTDFIYDMFSYELANHEYTYTRDLSDTLNVLNISETDIKNNPNLKNGLKLAVEDALEYERKQEEYEL